MGQSGSKKAKRAEFVEKSLPPEPVIQPTETKENISPTLNTWYKSNGKSFTEMPDKWFNLKSGRFVAHKPKYDPIFSIRGIRVLGTFENISQFWLNNVNILGQALPKGTTFENAVFQPFKDIAYICEEARKQSCQDKYPLAERTLDFTDVAELKPDTDLGVFYLGGVFLKALVVHVKDGDTFDVIVNVRLSQLAKQGRVLLSGKEDASFFTKLTIRTYGYDAAEHDTQAGQLAKRLLTEKLESINNIIWCQLVDPSYNRDPHGRQLAIFYEDEARTKLLNTYLQEMESVHNTRMVYAYLGTGEKEKFI